MIQTKASSHANLVAESEQAIRFLNAISDQLKQQRRHFDDAVVTHCIRLINDYVEEKSKDSPSEKSPQTGDAPPDDGQPS